MPTKSPNFLPAYKKEICFQTRLWTLLTTDNCCLCVQHCIVLSHSPSEAERETSDMTPYALSLLFFETHHQNAGWRDSSRQPRRWKVTVGAFEDFSQGKNIISDNHRQSVSMGHSVRYKWALLLVYWSQVRRGSASKNWYPADNEEEEKPINWLRVNTHSDSGCFLPVDRTSASALKLTSTTHLAGGEIINSRHCWSNLEKGKRHSTLHEWASSSWCSSISL